MAIKHYNNDLLTTFFRDYMLAENMSRSTVRNYISDFDHFMAWVSFNLSITNSSEIIDLKYISTKLLDIISLYTLYLEKGNNPLSTFLRKLYCLRKFGQFCLEMKVIDKLTYEHLLEITKVKVSSNKSWSQILSSFEKEVSSNKYTKEILYELKNSNYS